MTGLVKEGSIFNSKLAVYTLMAAFIFTLGFFIHFGKEAHASKSWQYVMSDTDVLYYWSVAKGRMMTPRCDGSPYYYEAQGTRNIIPPTTAVVTGLVSKYTRIPLSWFFPVSQILMPLLFWFVIVVCCWKLWNCPLGISAAGTMILLLSALFCPDPGISWTLLFRFPRPMDGIAPIFLWISLIFKGDPGNKKHLVAMIFVSAITLWLQPYYAAFCLWITALEFIYSFVKKEGVSKKNLYLCALGSSLVSGLIYVGYMFYGKTINPGLSGVHAMPALSFFYCSLTIPVLVFFAAVVFFFHHRLKKEVTALDRVVTEWALWGILVYFASTQIPVARETPIHMLYFAPVMMFSMAGWIHEKMCALKEARLFSHFSNAFMFLCVAFLALSVILGKNLFSAASSHYYVYCTQYFFVFLFFIWILERFDFLRRMVMRKQVVWAILLGLALAGYWKIPINLANRDYPFDRAYRWLKQNAQKNEVVLTASLKYRLAEYLFLKTGLKSYYYVHGGDHFDPAQIQRRNFVTGLLLGILDKMPRYEEWTIDQKLRAFRLDYVLMPKPSPFYDAITTQLRGHLLEVYQDPRCVIWRVM